jgi:hypothetical protein
VLTQKAEFLCPASGCAIPCVECPQIRSKKISNFLNTIKALKLKAVSILEDNLRTICNQGTHSLPLEFYPDQRDSDSAPNS